MGDYPEFSGTDGELRLRARSACHPSSRCNDGVVTFTMSPQGEAPICFAASLQVAAWCEGKEVVGIVGDHRVWVRPGNSLDDILDVMAGFI